MNHRQFLDLSYHEWIPTYLLVGDTDYCTYCGEFARDRDHVIPISTLYRGRSGNYSHCGLVTPSCQHCNLSLGPKVFDLLHDRIHHCTQRYTMLFKERQKKQRGWSKKELAELDYSLSHYVQMQQFKYENLARQIDWPHTKQFRNVCKLIRDQVDRKHPALTYFLCEGLVAY